MTEQRFPGARVDDALALNRAERRRLGFRGPAVAQHRGTTGLTRSVARAYKVASAGKHATRRYRKARAKIMCALTRRGFTV